MNIIKRIKNMAVTLGLVSASLLFAAVNSHAQQGSAGMPWIGGHGSITPVGSDLGVGYNGPALTNSVSTNASGSYVYGNALLGTAADGQQLAVLLYDGLGNAPAKDLAISFTGRFIGGGTFSNVELNIGEALANVPVTGTNAGGLLYSSNQPGLICPIGTLTFAPTINGTNVFTVVTNLSSTGGSIWKGAIPEIYLLGITNMSPSTSYLTNWFIDVKAQ